MKITEEVIPHIEKALGFELYDNQKTFLLGKGSLTGGRRSGKTLAYCVRLALSNGKPLNLKTPEKFSDGWMLINHRDYSRNFFKHEFMNIRGLLRLHGFPVRDVRF